MKPRDVPEIDLRSVAGRHDATYSPMRFIAETRDAPETDLRYVVPPHDATHSQIRFIAPAHDAPQAHNHPIFHPVLWNERLNYDNMNARKLIKGGYYEIHYI